MSVLKDVLYLRTDLCIVQPLFENMCLLFGNFIHPFMHADCTLYYSSTNCKTEYKSMFYQVTSFF